jgi:hypothetical protein
MVLEYFGIDRRPMMRLDCGLQYREARTRFVQETVWGIGNTERGIAVQRGMSGHVREPTDFLNGLCRNGGGFA